MLSTESLSYLISGMADTTSGQNLAYAIQNSTALSPSDYIRLQDCISDDVSAANLQACILGTSCLSIRDQQFLKDGFSFDDSAFQSVLSNLAGGYQQGAPLFNTSVINVSMPAGFQAAITFVGPASQMFEALTLPAGSVFTSTGPGQYFELFTGGNAHKYYVWYNVSGGSNTDPAPMGFTGVEVTILSGDTAAQVATKTQTALNAVTSASLLNSAATYAVLGASAVTGSTGAGSVLTGNLGIYPNNATSITNFPPSTYTGVENAGNAAAHTAQNDALAAYTSLQAMTPTTIATELGGQSLAPGVYTASSGTFTLNGTLTLTGSASSIYVFQTASTLITGGTSTPVMAIGSVLPANIYWVVGSSATLNMSHAGTFDGNVIAQASVTDTLGGTVNGSLIALTAAVTLSNTAAITAPPGGPVGPVISGAKTYVSGAVATIVLDQTFNC